MKMDKDVSDKTRLIRRILFSILLFVMCILVHRAYLWKFAPRNGELFGYICDFLLRYIVIIVISGIIKSKIVRRFLKFERHELYYMRVISEVCSFIGLIVIDYLLYTKCLNQWLVFLTVVILWFIFVLIESVLYYFLDCGYDADNPGFKSLLKKVLVMDYIVLAVLLVVSFFVCIGLNECTRYHQPTLDEKLGLEPVF